MEVLNKIKDWAGGLAHAGVSLIGLGIVLEILFSGMNIPFWPNVAVTGNILTLLSNYVDYVNLGIQSVCRPCFA